MHYCVHMLVRRMMWSSNLLVTKKIEQKSKKAEQNEETEEGWNVKKTICC